MLSDHVVVTVIPLFPEMEIDSLLFIHKFTVFLHDCRCDAIAFSLYVNLYLK